MTDFSDFSNDPNEQEGYYYATSVDPWEGAQLRSSRKPERWADFKDDGNAVIFLGKESPDETKWFEVKDADGAVVRYTFDVTAAAAINYQALSPTLKKSELQAIAASQNIPLPEKATKAQILEAIEEAGANGLRDSG